LFTLIAREKPIQNDDPTWNRQDFVLNVVESLVEQSVIEQDEFYYAGMEAATSCIEGLDEDRLGFQNFILDDWLIEEYKYLGEIFDLQWLNLRLR
jgi:hypothetical protein